MRNVNLWKLIKCYEFMIHISMGAVCNTNFKVLVYSNIFQRKVVNNFQFEHFAGGCKYLYIFSEGNVHSVNDVK